MSQFKVEYSGKARATESDLKACDALIGMDVITLGDMAITNNPSTTFTFRIPSEGEFTH